MSATNVLAINAGSSSIKFALFATEPSLRQSLAGRLSGVGGSFPTLQIYGERIQDEESHIVTAPDHQAAVEVLLEWFDTHRDRLSFGAIGHRVVHGGDKFIGPQQITAQVLEALHALRPFAPKHLPEELLLTKAFHDRFPDVPQVACFDTAFHHDLPRVATLLPIPRRFEAQGVRRYGFHGLSYTYLMKELTRLEGHEMACGRVILAHLGSGASLAAVHKGKPIDTSMSFTPTGGVPMGTRSGDLDPGLLSYLARDQHMSAAQLDTMVTCESGLLGISETSFDMRDLLRREKEDYRSAEAIAVFCYQIKKWIGAFAAAIGGVDAVVFSGGIGENMPIIRGRICEGLGFLGIELDEMRNAANGRVISASTAPTLVRVINTDEQRTIAELTCERLRLGHMECAIS